ncbi:MAG: HAMP domain-containing protein [Bacteroides sp.]|nr:HAMP domain-containing protein [Bacteroides sp.]
MRLKGLFWVFALLLLTALGFLTYKVAYATPWMFYLLEGLILVTVCFLIVFYRRIVRPLHTIGSGMELLREQDFSSRLSLVGQYEADRVVKVFNRMMEQLKNERLRMREQNHFLDLLIHASPMGVILLSLDEQLTQLNPMALKMLGVSQEEALLRKITEIDSPLAAELASIPLGKTQIVRLNDSNIYKCTHSSFIDRGFHHPFYLIEGLTEEVFRAEKKAYEKVIRMIAHEVNNTTAGITSTLDTVAQALEENEGMEEIREVMGVCVERCFSMSRFITRFADVVKIPDPHLSAVDMNELIATCKRFMEGMCADHGVTIRMELSEQLRPVQMDAALIEQVVVNIIKNAVESIGENGEITIRTFAPAGIEVIDNGAGISKETAAKLFTPFFSTKPNGQGIGLIFIREILSRHGCTFSLRTYADGLTRFRILFP